MEIQKDFSNVNHYIYKWYYNVNQFTLIWISLSSALLVTIQSSIWCALLKFILPIVAVSPLEINEEEKRKKKWKILIPKKFVCFNPIFWKVDEFNQISKGQQIETHSEISPPDGHIWYLLDIVSYRRNTI